MRAKVFFLTFGGPIIPVILAFVIFKPISSNIGAIIVSVFLIGILIRLFTTKRKYVIQFLISETDLTINYLSPFLKNKSEKIALASIKDYEFTKVNWIVEYPAELNIKCEHHWLTYHIINKRLQQEFRARLATANCKEL